MSFTLLRTFINRKAVSWSVIFFGLKRMDWASSVGQQISDRARPAELGDAILGPVLSDHTRTAVTRAESPSQGLALLLASPEFQRR